MKDTETASTEAKPQGDGANEFGQESKQQATPPKPAEPTARKEHETDWKAEARKWEQRAKENFEKLKPLEKLAKALDGDEGESSKADPVAALEDRLSKHEQELAQERSARWRAEIAHEKGLTPQQAQRLQGSTREELAADADALKELFPASEPKKFQGSGDGGARAGSEGPSQLTREDLKRMSPSEIVKAKSEGRLADLLGHA